MKALLNPWIARLLGLLRGLGPYAAIELLLPGGSVIALLIWLYRHRANAGQRRHEFPPTSERAAAVISYVLFDGVKFRSSSHAGAR